MSRTRPLIGISTYLVDEARWGQWHLPAALLPAGYHRLTQRAGGLAALLPPDAPARAAETLRRLDGLIIAGGPDLDPARYGAEADARTDPVTPTSRERDEWELALIDAALAAELPLLGVCRGAQLLNVARGGTLRQHMEGHRERPGVFGAHEIKPVPGTRLASLLPEAVTVPAYHHQAVAELGTGVIASAYAADGVVEALELPAAGGFALGVQWHPEMGEDARVLRGLVEAAG
ncbi:gamma-glutamyl-gamma-aminobutyrate hydrolase family protein [Streptomyces sp. NBC_01808]|uniref:gamma-glutamyl-gamma-aminobutyrate hydrolase family protein n=1 Tax=Streptomyces sp. NBC_01808 TaxID=2975947 RepID=UPI002DD923F7|nr:gamma-glutamyl-gamma-aminobutyrate hydrolase family protein [Streptomyces sp. NBC_01808]WSA36820.1 gamma-glutamyl-gamma-aminobutyrate hydrolase family protein [Streptomyces sp. NBC_01808]